jgi:hypothetical protein
MTGSSRSRLAWRCDGKRRRIGDGEPASGGLAVQIHHMTDNPKFDLVNAKLTAEALLGPDFPAYWQALGCFVDRFTGVELNLQTLLWLFAGVPMPTAQAVFRNTSANRAMEIIWRVAGGPKLDRRKKSATEAHLRSARQDQQVTQRPLTPRR